MRYGIFSDIHGNLEALEAVLGSYQSQGIEEYLCGGDLVGYGPDPLECIKKTKAISSQIVAGNHDWAAVEKFDISYFNPIAKEAILWTRRNLFSQEKDFLSSLKLVYENEDLLLVHGSLKNPQEFPYIIDLYEAKELFQRLNKKVCFIGHSHIPGVFIKSDDNIKYFNFQNFTLKKDHQYIVNVGSVGQPRDGDWRACYVIYDTEKKFIQIKRVSYDIKTVQKKIISKGLPMYLALRLGEGR